MNIDQESTAEIQAAQITATSTAQPLATIRKAYKGVLVLCPPTNTAPVYVGTSNVSATNGVPFYPGVAIVIPIDDPAKLHIFAATNQTVAWMVL